MKSYYDDVQTLLDNLLAELGTVDEVASALAADESQKARDINLLVDSVHSAHEGQYDWMNEHDVNGWNDDTADVNDDMMDAEF